MLINGEYRDETSDTDYFIKEDVILDNCIYHITGDNGAGKSRFIEGVLLKELKRQKIRILYFSQDIENQILSFELIDLVKNFIDLLKRSGKFFRTILFNDDSHMDISLNFNEKSVLNPSQEDIREFIYKETSRYQSDVIIFDEVDKYFSNNEEFLTFIQGLENKTVFIISHIIDEEKLTSKKELHLNRESQEVHIVQSSTNH